MIGRDGFDEAGTGATTGTVTGGMGAGGGSTDGSDVGRGFRGAGATGSAGCARISGLARGFDVLAPVRAATLTRIVGFVFFAAGSRLAMATLLRMRPQLANPWESPSETGVLWLG